MLGFGAALGALALLVEPRGFVALLLPVMIVLGAACARRQGWRPFFIGLLGAIALAIAIGVFVIFFVGFVLRY